MRRFKLINAKGQEFDLMRKDSFFNSPAGLGFTLNITTATVGNTFIPTSNMYEPQPVSGEMVFAGYEQYKEFIDFLTDKITFAYSPLETWYYMDCAASVLAKGEIDVSTDRLLCGVDFTPFTQWYLPATFQQTQVEPSDGKVYEYTYPYTYAGAEMGAIDITNVGNASSPCRIYILGRCVNPRWVLRQGGEEIAEGKVNATIELGRKMLISSDPSDMQISELASDNTFVQSLYQASDFSTARFLYIPPGESTLYFYGDGEEAITAYVEVMQLAATV